MHIECCDRKRYQQRIFIDFFFSELSSEIVFQIKKKTAQSFCVCEKKMRENE